MPSANVQQQSARRRDHAHHGAEIGGSERKVAFASKAPFNAAGTCNAVHVPAKFTFEGRYPGDQLKPQAVIDHREAAGSKRQPSPISSCNGLSWLSRQVRQPSL